MTLSLYPAPPSVHPGCERDGVYGFIWVIWLESVFSSFPFPYLNFQETRLKKKSKTRDKSSHAVPSSVDYTCERDAVLWFIWISFGFIHTGFLYALFPLHRIVSVGFLGCWYNAYFLGFQFEVRSWFFALDLLLVVNNSSFLYIFRTPCRSCGGNSQEYAIDFI